jgi:hypothetical protein
MLLFAGLPVLALAAPVALLMKAEAERRGRRGSDWFALGLGLHEQRPSFSFASQQDRNQTTVCPR